MTTEPQPHCSRDNGPPQPQANSQAGSGQRSRAVFAALHDVYALKVIMHENPYADSSKWMNVATEMTEAFQKCYTPRNVRDRITLIYKKFVEGDKAALRRSGTEEEYDEREQLLTQLRSLREDTDSRNLVTARKRKRQEKGKRSRDEATSSISLDLDGSSMSVPIIVEGDYNLQIIGEDSQMSTTAPTNDVENPNMTEGQGSPQLGSMLLDGPDVLDSQPNPPYPSEPAVREVNHRTTSAGDDVLIPTRMRRQRGQASRSLADYMAQRREDDHATRLRELAVKEKQAETEARRVSLEMERFLHQRKMEERQQLDAIRNSERQEIFMKNVLEVISRNEQRQDTFMSNMLELINQLADKIRKN